MFAILCVHWFNPLVWAAFVLCSRDMEMSCDERVLKTADADIRKAYSSSLLTLAAGRRILSAAPLAFGEGNTKQRIKNVLSYKKPALWVIICAVIAVAVTAVCLAANPVKQAAMSAVTISFPANENGKTEYSAKIFNEKSFDVSLLMPNGAATSDPKAQSGVLFSEVDIIGKDGAKLATIGYNAFEYTPEVEDSYMAVYNQLMLGSMVNWNFDYVEVSRTDDCVTATCSIHEVVFEEGKSAAESPQRVTRGILSYSKRLGVYIGIQFEENAVTEEQLTEIAKSVAITGENPPAFTSDNATESTTATPASTTEYTPETEEVIIETIADISVATPDPITESVTAAPDEVILPHDDFSNADISVDLETGIAEIENFTFRKNDVLYIEAHIDDFEYYGSDLGSYYFKYTFTENSSDKNTLMLTEENYGEDMLSDLPYDKNSDVVKTTMRSLFENGFEFGTYNVAVRYAPFDDFERYEQRMITFRADENDMLPNEIEYDVSNLSAETDMVIFTDKDTYSLDEILDGTDKIQIFAVNLSDEVVRITASDFPVSYYEDGEWKNYGINPSDPAVMYYVRPFKAIKYAILGQYSLDWQKGQTRIYLHGNRDIYVDITLT